MTKELRLALYSTLLVVVLVLVFDRYARWPSAIEPAPLGLPSGTRTAVLMFHDAGGRDDPALVALEQRARGFAAGAGAVAVVRYDWRPYSEARFRAGSFGLRIGEVLGHELAGVGTLKAVHVITNGVAAFIAGPLCEALKESGRTVRVDVTYLDPIGMRGIVQPGWGASEFGRCGDYVEAYINTDDAATASSQPLERAWNVDVTRAPGKDAFAPGGHTWPLAYYLEHATADDILPGHHDHIGRLRGAVELR